MGYRISRYVLAPVDPNTQVELGDLKLCHDPRSVLHGRIVDCDGNAVKNALVKIFSFTSGDPCACTAALTPLGHVFTDPCGQFLFIVCDPTKSNYYLIKVFKNNSLEESVDPTACSDISITDAADNCCDPSCANLLN